MKRIDEVLSKQKYTDKIIQFGEGGFLRGFVDLIIKLTNEATGFDAGVTVVQPIKQGLCDKLEAQGCMYTHISRGISEGQLVCDQKVIDVITHTVKPYDDFNSYLALAEDPNYRFVVSNTTESGIAFNAEDRPENAPDVSFPAKVTLLLHKRYELGLNGFIFLPCELIDKNGATLKKYIIEYAKLWGYEEAFIEYIENKNIFCNTLVDRIVTGYPKNEQIDLGYADDMLNTSEHFLLWVIEGDRAILNELPIDKCGLNIIVTDNLEMYRTRKVRILNGAHTSMIPYALLEGIETVGDCMKNENMSAFVKKCVFEEIIPTLDLPESELVDYANSVFERFENPYIKHLCASISLNSVSKFKVRVLPSIIEYVKRKGSLPENLTLSFAKLIEFYRTDMPNDDAEAIERMRKDSVKEILADEKLWGENIDKLIPGLAQAVEGCIGK